VPTYSPRTSAGFTAATVLVCVALAAALATAWSNVEAPQPLPVSPPAVALLAPASLALADPITRTSGREIRREHAVHVVVLDPEGRPLQRPWRLALRSVGHDPLDKDYGAGSEDVRVDLPPGTWTFAPEAEDLAARPVEVEIGVTPIEVELRFHRAAQVLGSVRDENGDPVRGLPLGLRDFDGHFVARASSDAWGAFRFEHVPAGPYELLAGCDAAPLWPTRHLEIHAGSQVLETLRTPALRESKLSVVTEDGRPVAGASVEGTGRRGGGFTGSTGADGTFVAQFLPAGRYRIVASRDDLGVGEGRLEVGPETPSSAAILLRQ